MKRIPTAAGLLVRSEPERQIADWLHARGLPFEYEAKLEGLRPDFMLPHLHAVIEYWGGPGFTRYARRMVEKTAVYEAAGWHVIHVVQTNLWELGRVLSEGLEAARAARELDGDHSGRRKA